MTARIARGGSVRTGRGRAAPARAPAKKRRKKQPSVFESIGLTADSARHAAGWLVVAVILIAMIAAALIFRLPQLVALEAGEAIGRAGFAVRRVEIRGLNHMARLPVYAVALDQQSMAMPLVDLDGTRNRLLRYGWIRDARVSRRLPDTLVVDVVERRPAAIWQQEGRLALIDTEGVVLQAVRLEAMPDLPLVIGADANRHVPALEQLLQATPHLRPQITGATWVGGRRWDVRFATGEVLALPETDEAARRAMLTFARMDQQQPLLGRGYARFDMRVPGRVIVRLTRQPGGTVPAIAPETPDGAEPHSPPPDLARTI